jgi:hypothetical protein
MLGDRILPDVMSWPEDYVVQYLFSAQEKSLAIILLSNWIPLTEGVNLVIICIICNHAMYLYIYNLRMYTIYTHIFYIIFV